MKKISLNLNRVDYQLLTELNEKQKEFFEPLEVTISDTIRMAIWEAYNLSNKKDTKSK